MRLLPSPWRPWRRLLLGLDVGVVIAAMAATPAERGVLGRLVPLRGLPPIAAQLPEYILLASLVLPLWLALTARLGLYRLLEEGWSLARLAFRLLSLHALGFVALATLVYATQVVFNRSVVALFMVNSCCGMFVLRTALVLWRRYQYRQGTGRVRLLLAGAMTGPLRAFYAATQAAAFAPLVVGCLTPDAPGDEPADAARDEPAAAPADDAPRRIGGLGELETVLHDHPVDQVLFFRPYDRADGIEDALLCCELLGVPALLAVDIGTPDGTAPRIASLHGRPFASLALHPERQGGLAIKHGFDFVAALLALVLLSPLMLLAALAIVLTMGRPVLFAQNRAGLRGRPFRMLKLRTMVVGAEQRQDELRARNEMDGPVFKVENDPRITPLGRWLRKTSIDELPQLLHVLTGTMSLVGPRPLPLDEQRRIRGWHRRRLAMRPGITGLWQIRGRNNTTFERWMELDLQYVDGWSLGLDAKILFQTIPVVLMQKGAR